MAIIELKQHRTGKVLYTGEHRNKKEALEQAATNGIDLSGVELSGENLDHAVLDDIKMQQAYIRQCSLRYCNLSESLLNRAKFIDCDLSHACLAYASMRQTSVIETPIAHAELSGAWIENMIFSCPSGLLLDYSRCSQFKNSIYIHNQKTHCLMMKEPIFIRGLGYDVILMNDHIKVGCVVKKYDEMAQLKPEVIERLFGSQARDFRELYQPFLSSANRLATIDQRTLQTGIDNRQGGC